MPIHLYIEQYFRQFPKARQTGIEIKNPPLDKRPKVFRIEERFVKTGSAEIPIRIYTPNEEEKHPVFIFFHGGNLIPGGIETHDVSCRLICSLAGYKVIAVDYCTPGREEKMLSHCYDATKWIVDHVEELGGLPNQLAIGGPSIGAHFAANIVLHFILQENIRFKKQVLHYPIIQFDQQIKDSPHFSRALFNGKYGIDLSLHSLSLSNIKDASVSYYAPFDVKNEVLAQMPPTLIFTAEYDPFCDEGEEFAELLKQAGVDVKHVRFDGNVHGFMQNFPGSPDFMRGHELTAEFLMN